MINSTLQFQEQKRQRLVDVCHKVLIPIVCNRDKDCPGALAARVLNSPDAYRHRYQ